MLWGNAGDKEAKLDPVSWAVPASLATLGKRRRFLGSLAKFYIPSEDS